MLCLLESDEELPAPRFEIVKQYCLTTLHMPLLVMNGIHQQSVLMFVIMMSSYGMNWLNYMDQIRDILISGDKTKVETVQEDLS